MDHESVLPRRLAYHLLEEMSNGFSEDRELGRGTYGKVYLGINKDGEKIAVKVLHGMTSLDDNDQQFDKEFQNLTCLRHANIVGFVGYCHETQRECVSYKGRIILAEVTKRALCFEYMHNGSLDNCLSDEFSGHGWHTRYALIKGICDGLKYLHEELQPPIFHLDLKPANILLDEDMVPKLADFGLSRLFGEEQTRITTSSIGTIGYLPPEFINRNVISNKFDIFSLGVVIIKIMTGRTGYSKCGEMSSHEFIEIVHENWRSRLHAKSVCILDSYSEQVKRCIEIAISCVEADRDQRPSIGDIISRLNETETVIHGRTTMEDIINELSETEPISQFPDASPNAPGSLMDQKCQQIMQYSQGENQTHRTKEEEKRETERVSNTENLIGTVVDNYKLDKMERYMGKPKMQEDRAREALILMNEDDKDSKASNYVYSLIKWGTGNNLCALCLVYNATGESLYLVANYDWHGHIGMAPYPTEIGKGQWAAFRHATSWPTGSTAAVVYRGKNKDGEDQDYLLAWRNPFYLYPNKCYCEIGGVDNFQKRWPSLKTKLDSSDYFSNPKSDGYEIQAKICKGQIPKFTAIISYR